MKFMQKSILITLTLLTLFLSLSAVSSATFNNTSTTQDIQDFINSNTSTDKELVLDGEFNNLSTLKINRPMKISGKPNTVITKNSSSSSTMLFNITVVNVTIENLIIRGYGTAIRSNNGNLTIQNNQINSTDTAIYIACTEATNNTIKNNKITTTGNNSHGIYLYSYVGPIHNSSVYNNTISTNGNNSHGIYLESSLGNITSNIICNNSVFTTENNSHGIYLFSYHVNGNSICNNSVFTTGNSSVGIYLFSFLINGNSICNNSVFTTGNSSVGISLVSFSSVMDNKIVGNNILVKSIGIQVGGNIISGLNVYYNRILANGTFINLTQKNSSNLFFANWLGNNTPDISKIINIDLISFYTVNAIAFKNTGIVGDNWIIKYVFYLNGTDNLGDYLKLPFFQAQLLNGSNWVDNRTAYDTGDWNIPIESMSVNNFTVVLDNEVIPLGTFTSEKGGTTSTIEIHGEIGINKTVRVIGVLKNTQGNPLANKKVTLFVNGVSIGSKNTDSNGRVSFDYTFKNAGDYTFQLIFEGDDQYNSTQSEELIMSINEPTPTPTPSPNPSPNPSPDTESNDEQANKTSDNSVVPAGAAMKETGIPIIAILLVLLTSLGLLARKK